MSTLAADSPVAVDVLPTVYDSLPKPVGVETEQEAFFLPVVTLPSADLDDVKVVNLGPKVKSSGLRGDEGVGYEGVRLYLKLFDDDVCISVSDRVDSSTDPLEQSVPAVYDPNGAVVRSLIFDIIDLYEINRKECAAILLQLPKWCKRGTFRGKDGEDDLPADAREWSLENLVVEVRP